MKKICLITGNELPVPAVLGGAVETLVTILIEQNEIEKQVELYVFSGENEAAEKQAAAYQYTQITYISKDGILTKVANRIRRALTPKDMPGEYLDSGYYRKIYSRVKHIQPDVIVAEGGLYHELRSFAKLVGRENLYLHIHHHLLAQPEFDGIFGGYIAISEFAKKEWIRTTKEEHPNVSVVYNCVNEERFLKRITQEERQELRSRLGFSPTDCVVLYCGRIQEVKGVRELLLSMQQLAGSGIRLLLIGSADFALNTKTPFTIEVAGLVDEMGEQVKFTGYIPNEELYQYYQCADMQVVPSMWEEAGGLVAIEGMLSGLPIIVTKSGGLIEYAPEQAAVWVSREEIVSNLTREIGKLAEDTKRRKQLSAAALEWSQRFTKAGFYQSYLDVFGKETNE